MNVFWQQFKFDSKREILRNLPFLFFSLLMPAGFYLLFTKVMVSGTQAEMRHFSGAYMGSMIVYSVIISAFFGLATLLQRDRRSGYFDRLQQLPVRLWPYYGSIATCFMLMTVLAVGLMVGLAVAVNHVRLGLGAMGLIVLVTLLGELPLFVISTIISRVRREETLSVISNLLTFPVAIVSGLWWPLTMLPGWLQGIGKALPTYRLNHLLNAIIVNRRISGYDWVMLVGWIGVALVALGIQQLTVRRWRQGVTQ